MGESELLGSIILLFLLVEYKCMHIALEKDIHACLVKYIRLPGGFDYLDRILRGVPC